MEHGMPTPNHRPARHSPTPETLFRPQELGRRLKQRRLELHQAATTVAKAAHVTPTYLWMLERAKPGATGKASPRPSVEVLADLARILLLDPQELYALAGYESLQAISSVSPMTTPIAGGNAEPHGAGTRLGLSINDVLLPLPEHWFGREKELEWLLDRLQVPSTHRNSHRTIALAGMAGMGKTALAALVVQRVQQEHR